MSVGKDPTMRVLIAPDSFGDRLTAPEAAGAIAEGWLRGAPGDEVEQIGLSDGGPGFVSALAGVLGGRLLNAAARDPWLRPVDAHLLVVGTTAYIESSQACGLHLVCAAERFPGLESTAGVADLIEAAVGAGATKVVVGLGGSATNDGGAGLLDACGMRPRDDAGRALPPVPARLGEVDHVDRPHPGSWAVELVAASDVENVLLGPEGATAVFGPQKGIPSEDIEVFDATLARFVEAVGRSLPGSAGLELRPGAGAAGGLGYGLFILGASRQSGIELVLGATGLAERIARSDIVITGEGSFDGQSRYGKVVAGVGRLARSSSTHCVVLAGRVVPYPGDFRDSGISAVYSVAATVGSEAAGLAEPRRHLAALAERVARLGPDARGPA